MVVLAQKIMLRTLTASGGGVNPHSGIVRLPELVLGLVLELVLELVDWQGFRYYYGRSVRLWTVNFIREISSWQNEKQNQPQKKRL